LKIAPEVYCIILAKIVGDVYILQMSGVVGGKKGYEASSFYTTFTTHFELGKNDSLKPPSVLKSCYWNPY
jgi:hypothetical protein